MSDKANRLRELVSEVASAYFSNTQVAPEQVAGVLDQIATSLGAIGAPPHAADDPKLARPEDLRRTPAEIRNSIRPDGITSFEDGRSYKTLRRHLSGLGLTPAQYRQKWGLPVDYPMVASNLSAARSEMARRMRLGRSSTAARKPAPDSRRKPREKQVSR